MTSNDINNADSADDAGAWRESLGQLMSQLVDGELSADQHRELVAILESSDEAKRYYLSYLQVHGELGHQWGDELPLRIDHGDEKTEVPLNRPAETQDIRRTFRALGWLFLGMAASGLFFAFVAIPEVRQWDSKPTSVAAVKTDPDIAPDALVLEQTPGDRAASESPTNAGMPEARTELPSTGWNDVAVIVRNEGVEDAALQVGKRLTPGIVRFESGTLQLQFMSGASMVLAGPAELRIDSAKVATLLAGTVKTRVNERAKGFVLNTTEAAVVDIGTEFGLRFDDSGHPEVEVMEGEVEFSLLGADGSTLSSRRVLESEVVAIDRDAPGEAQLAEKAKRDSSTKSSFEGPQIELPIVSLPGNSNEYSQAIREASPLVYWRFESMLDGIVPNEMDKRWAARVVHSDPANPTLSIDGGRLHLQRGDTSRYVTSVDPIHGLDDGPFTVEFWMNPDDLEHSHCVGLAPFLKKDPMAFLGVVEVVTDTFLIHQPGSLRILYRNPPERGQQYGKNVFSPGMVTPGQWHHVTMVKTDESLGLYLNGQSIRVVESHLVSEQKSEDGFRIIMGQLTRDYVMRQFAGSMDEFALYDRALDPAEILQHYQAASVTH